MTKETTPTPPDASTSASNPQPQSHPPPSLPNSPLAKRPKTTNTNMSPPAPETAATGVTESSAVAPSATSVSESSPPSLHVKKLVPEARAPTRGSAFAAGYDLYCAQKITIPAKGKGLVSTGLAIAVPVGTCKFLLFFSFLRFFSFWAIVVCDW